MASDKEFVDRNRGIAEEQGDGPGEEAGTSGLENVYCNQGDLKQAIEFKHRLSLFAAIILEDRGKKNRKPVTLLAIISGVWAILCNP